MTLTREEARESKDMESLRVHADALLSLSSPGAPSSTGISKPSSSSTTTTTTTPAARRALAAEGVFECKTCSKRFSSFQALGGHRTSHTRLQARMLLHAPADHAADRDRARVHECAVCGLEFSMGQALGGHMRRHRGEATTSTAAVHGDAASSGATHPDVVMPDLNYPPMEECSSDGQESSAAHSSDDHQLLHLLV